MSRNYSSAVDYIILTTLLMCNSINCRLHLEGLLRISSRLHLLAPKIRVRVGLVTNK